MITARDALHLPRARLAEEDAEQARLLMERIDELVRAEFKRAPLRIPVSTEMLSPVVVAEVTQHLRRSLWRVAWEQQVGMSAITRQQVVTGVYLILEPALEAYEDVSSNVVMDADPEYERIKEECGAKDDIFDVFDHLSQRKTIRE